MQVDRTWGWPVALSGDDATICHVDPYVHAQTTEMCALKVPRKRLRFDKTSKNYIMARPANQMVSLDQENVPLSFAPRIIYAAGLF
jgi:hypothetical protein